MTDNYVTDPDPPRDLEIQNIADEYASLTWNNPLSPVQSYKISYQKYGSNKWEVETGIPAEKDTLDHFGKSTKKTPNSRQLNGLEPGTNYIVKVEGLITGGRYRDDFYSPPITKSFWTEIDPVTDLKSSKITLNSVAISWKKPIAKECDFLSQKCLHTTECCYFKYAETIMKTNVKRKKSRKLVGIFKVATFGISLTYKQSP